MFVVQYCKCRESRRYQSHLLIPVVGSSFSRGAGVYLWNYLPKAEVEKECISIVQTAFIPLMRGEPTSRPAQTESRNPKKYLLACFCRPSVHYKCWNLSSSKRTRCARGRKVRKWCVFPHNEKMTPSATFYCDINHISRVPLEGTSGGVQPASCTVLRGLEAVPR
jgi:hypothetical protein